MKSWLVRVFERARSDGASMALISQLVASISAVGISWACEAAYVRFSSHLSHSALTFGTGQRDTSSGLGLNKFWEPPQSISLILNRCAVFFFETFECDLSEYVRNQSARAIWRFLVIIRSLNSWNENDSLIRLHSVLQQSARADRFSSMSVIGTGCFIVLLVFRVNLRLYSNINTWKFQIEGDEPEINSIWWFIAVYQTETERFQLQIGPYDSCSKMPYTFLLQNNIFIIQCDKNLRKGTELNWGLWSFRLLCDG